MFLRGKVYMSVNYIKGEAICFVILVHNVHKKINSSTCLGESKKMTRNIVKPCHSLIFFWTWDKPLVWNLWTVIGWTKTFAIFFGNFGQCWQFLTILTTLDNFDNFGQFWKIWQFWQFWIILDSLGNFGQFWLSGQFLSNFDKCMYA